MSSQARNQFRELHKAGSFVMPNPWDVGSAKQFEALGVSALATTSAGLAASHGLEDMEISFEQLCAHVEVMAAAISVPLNVDSEQMFASTDSQVTANTAILLDLGAAGVSVEDFDPISGQIEPVEVGVARVRAAAQATKDKGAVLTGRAENYLHGIADLDDTIARLVAYRDAGADVVYAPGVVDESDIRKLVEAVECPLNVLCFRNCPPPSVLETLGVRRVSSGAGMAMAAYAAAVTAAKRLLAG